MQVKTIATTGVLLALAFFPLCAQEWQAVQSFGGLEDETLEVVTSGASGDIWCGGGFKGQLLIGDSIWRAEGEEDIFLLRWTSSGTIKPVLHLGGPGEDRVNALVHWPDGHWACAGTFWRELYLPGALLRENRESKAIFVARFGPDQSLRWAFAMEGTVVKAVTGMAGDAEGNLYIGGFFSDTLQLDTLVLTAKGRTDLFLIKVDQEGKVIWARQYGGKDDVRATALSAGPDGGLALAGIYNREAVFGQEVLTANTTDWDVFLARFSPAGELRWVRKAGGVYDDEANAVMVTPDGSIYVCGQIVGVMKLDEQLSIQSRDGNADAFLLKYSPDGQVRWGKALGGELIQSATHIAGGGDEIGISGFFQGSFNLDDRRITAGQVFNGFAAILDTNGQGRQLWHMASQEPIYPGGLVPTGPKRWMSGGVFRGMATFGNLTLQAPKNNFNAYLARFGTMTTANKDLPQPAGVTVYPNPAQDILHLSGLDSPGWLVELSDLNGRLLQRAMNAREIRLTGLPPGIYLLQVRSEGGYCWSRLVVKR